MTELTSTGKIRRIATRSDPSIVDGSRFRQGTVVPPFQRQSMLLAHTVT